jgi:hypothetical protein
MADSFVRSAREEAGEEEVEKGREPEDGTSGRRFEATMTLESETQTDSTGPRTVTHAFAS